MEKGHFDHNPVACPICGYRMDASTGMNCNDGPADGSISLCIKCGTVNVFVVTEGVFGLREITVEEFEEFRQSDPWAWAHIKQVQRAIAAARSQS